MRPTDELATLVVGDVTASRLFIADADGNVTGLWDGDTLSVVAVGGSAADVNDGEGTISGGKVRAGRIESVGYNPPDGAEVFADLGASFDLDLSTLITRNLRSDATGLKVRGGGGGGTLQLVDASGTVWGEFDGSTVRLGPGGGTRLEIIEGSVILEGSNFATIEAPDVVALAAGNIVVISAGSDYVDVQSGFTRFQGDIRVDDEIQAERFLFDPFNTIGFYESGTEIRYNSNAAHRWLDNLSTKMYLGSDGRLLLYNDLRMAGHPIVDAGAITCDAIDTRGGGINMGGGLLTEVNEISADVGSVSDVSYHFDGWTNSGMSGGTDGAVRLSSKGVQVFGGLGNEAYIAPVWDFATTAGSYVRITGSGGRIGRHSSSGRYKTHRTDLTLDEAMRALRTRWINYSSTAPGDRPEDRLVGAVSEQVEEDVDARLVQYDSEEHGPAPRTPEGINYDLYAAYHGRILQHVAPTLEDTLDRVAFLEGEVAELKKMLREVVADITT